MIILTYLKQGFIQPFVSGGEYETLRGYPNPLPREGGPGENFEIWDAIWCNLEHFGKKLTFFEFSTFVNENIVIVIDIGIDIVAYYFNF